MAKVLKILMTATRQALLFLATTQTHLECHSNRLTIMVSMYCKYSHPSHSLPLIDRSKQLLRIFFLRMCILIKRRYHSDITLHHSAVANVYQNKQQQTVFRQPPQVVKDKTSSTTISLRFGLRPYLAMKAFFCSHTLLSCESLS